VFAGAAQDRVMVDDAVGTPLEAVASVSERFSGAVGRPSGIAATTAPVKLQAPATNVVTTVPDSSQPAVTALMRNQY